MNGTFWEHLEELRWILLKVFGVVLFTSACLFVSYSSFYQWLTAPLESGITEERVEIHRLTNPTTTPVHHSLSNGETLLLAPKETRTIQVAVPAHQLLIFGPIEGMLSTLRISLWGGIALSSPAWLILILRFVVPALKPSERRILFPLTLCLVLFFILGSCFAWKLSLPVATNALYAFNAKIGSNMWGVPQYLEFTLMLLLAHGLAFELMAVLLFLVHFRKVSVDWLRGQRSKVIVATLVLAAILTPPDIITQALLAMPMIGLFELIILYGRFTR